MRYLALESSCDETAVAIWDTEQHRVEYERTLTQAALHGPYGGVVPGLAIREHLKGFHQLIESLRHSYDLSRIDAVCVTHGPGLVGCLGIGVAYAQALQLLLKVPLYGVNHLHGHALSPFLELFQADADFNWNAYCPHLGLLVSGGNTLLFEMPSVGQFRTLAQTVDDAAGEALDKGAKMLGFPYPGGALIERCGQSGDAQWVRFPRAFPHKSDLRFSFSGLKTSLRVFLDKLSADEVEQHKADICAAYQEAVVDALSHKVQQVLSMGDYKSLGLSGGVANNSVLRNRLQQVAEHYGIPLVTPPKCYCGDNAAMIAFSSAQVSAGLALDPNLTLDTIK